jgi:hypothetical protein
MLFSIVELNRRLVTKAHFSVVLSGFLRKEVVCGSYYNKITYLVVLQSLQLELINYTFWKLCLQCLALKVENQNSIS